MYGIGKRPFVHPKLTSKPLHAHGQRKDGDGYEILSNKARCQCALRVVHNLTIGGGSITADQWVRFTALFHPYRFPHSIFAAIPACARCHSSCGLGAIQAVDCGCRTGSPDAVPVTVN